MTASERTGPPPRRALKCPNGHTRWQVHDESFYCTGCPTAGYDDARFRELWDQRTGTYLAHGEFVDRWGTDPYG